MPETTEKQAGEREFAPCPICKQYSHSIGEDQLAAAFMHFGTMYSHRGDGIPTQFCFPMETRDAAQILMAAARRTPPTPAYVARLEEALKQIFVRTYSTDGGCSLRAESVNEICSIARQALAPEALRDGESEVGRM